LAEAFPERVARARGGAGEFLLVNGRGAFLDPADALAREPWLAVAELSGGGARDRIRLAAPLTEAAVLAEFESQIVTEDRLERSPAGRLQARRVRRLGAIVISEQSLETADPALIRQALLEEVRAGGLGVLPWSEAAEGLRARAALLRGLEGDAWPDLSDAALMAELDGWLAPLLADRRRLQDLGAGELTEALLANLPWERRQALDRLAPERWTAPTGSGLRIDYAAEGGPTVSVRVQELFGLKEHPAIAGGRIPLVLALLSPAHRPIQVTRDLPGFWRGSWKDVRAQMRGRYPKHPWPEDPDAAPPTTRAKPRI
jgi:ATP-dependent helicase HrpB